MKIIDKIFRDKKANSVVYIVLAVGIIMLMSSSTFFYTKPDPAAEVKVEHTLNGETEAILSQIKGVGEAHVMISYSAEMQGEEKSEKIEGVLVVADGGESSVVREKIVSALGAALGVDAHKIQVFERKE